MKAVVCAGLLNPGALGGCPELPGLTNSFPHNELQTQGQPQACPIMLGSAALETGRLLTIAETGVFNHMHPSACYE